MGNQEPSGAFLGLGTRGEGMGACLKVLRVDVERSTWGRDIREAELALGAAGVSVRKTESSTRRPRGFRKAARAAGEMSWEEVTLGTDYPG